MIVVVALMAAAAWSALVLDAGGVIFAAFCSPRALWTSPSLGSLSFALALNPPASLFAGWMLMVAAMTPPLIVVPLRHVSERNFAVRRWRAMSWFGAGYAMAWMAAGLALEPLVFLARAAAPSSLAALGVASIVALAWQVSPAKQRCLNRCHRRPPLAAFGFAADRDALLFGLTHGAGCVGACWALMLWPLLLGHGHVPAMALVALFLFAERLERPAPLSWRWRGPGRALRIVEARARMQLAWRAR